MQRDGFTRREREREMKAKGINGGVLGKGQIVMFVEEHYLHLMPITEFHSAHHTVPHSPAD